MSADIVNLRRARKERARREKEVQAAENRTKFGRTKAEREHASAVTDLERRRLDAHELTTKPDKTED
mgnify:CR=1 FL=1